MEFLPAHIRPRAAKMSIGKARVAPRLIQDFQLSIDLNDLV